MKEESTPFLLALDLREKPVLVIGYGEEAQKRAQALLDAGAHVSLIVPEPAPELESWAQDRAITIEVREPVAEDVRERWLVVLAEQNSDWATRLGRAARQERVFFCAVDQPEWNSFAHVAVVRSGSLQLGISSAGRSPALVAGLRRELSRLFTDAGLPAFLERMSRLREKLDPSERGPRLRALAAEVRLTGKLDLPKWFEGDGSENRDPE